MAKTRALPLRLSKSIDRERARASMDAHGHAAIRPVLQAGDAKRLHERVTSWPHWGLVTHLEGEHRMLDAAGMETVDPVKKAQFNALVHKQAAQGFQYLFDNFALYEMGRKDKLDDPVLKAAFDLVRSDAFLELARAVTGAEDIAFADCQLTRYRPGHFLTLHDDGNVGKNRRAAYVLNLTPDWKADYGGQLQILDEAGDVERAYTPGFNRLLMFKVPRPHLVSCVAPFAPGARYAITGWVRAGEEPGV